MLEVTTVAGCTSDGANTLLYNGQRVQTQPPHPAACGFCGKNVDPHPDHQPDQLVVVSHGFVQPQPVQAV